MSSKSHTYYPASQNQKIYFFRNFYCQKNIQNVNFIFYLSLKFLDLDVLRKTLVALLKRYEIFRTTLILIDGKVKQKVWHYSKSFLINDVIDLSHVQNKNNEFQNIVADLHQKVFKYNKCPWFITKIVTLEKDVNVLVVSIPHMIVDARSVEIIQTEIYQIYGSYLRQEKIIMPKVLQFKDYIARIDENLNSKNGERLRYFWMNLLKDPPSTNLTTCLSYKNFDKPQTYKETIEQEIRNCFSSNKIESDFSGIVSNIEYSIGKTFLICLDQKQLKILKMLEDASNVSLAVVFIASFLLLLSKLTGENDIFIGINSSTRDNRELNSVVGFLINTVFFRFKILDTLSLIDYIRKVNLKFLEVQLHRNYPHERALYDSDIPFHKIGIFFMNIMKKNEITKMIFNPIHLNNSIHPYFDIDCHILIYKNMVEIQCKYKSEIFKESTIDFIFSNYLSMIDNFKINSNYSIRNIILNSDTNSKI
jgi:nonribosomal peptide synthetase DhbF